jgi:4-hydroxy-tetrahydrodipicolinate synthase
VREVGRIVRYARENDYAKAAAVHRKLYPLFKAQFLDPNPVPIKFALARAGIIRSAEVRLPLAPISAPTAQAFTQALAAAGK